MIRQATSADAGSIADIYNHYVEHTTVTFEEVPITATDIVSRMSLVASDSLPWLVAERDDEIIGYAYATKWKTRAAYRFSVESTVYLAPHVRGKGVGSQLFQALLGALKEIGVHAVMGGISLPNPASVALHEKLGMEKVAHFSQVGFKFGDWVDVGYWQLTADNE